MSMKFTRRTALAGIAALGIAGSLVSVAPAFAKDKTFAVIQINQQALFFNQINEGAQAEAKATGDKLVIFNANNDPQAQNSAIETYIEQKVDGIVVDAIDVNGIMPAVEEAAKAGIPVVALDAILPEGPQKAQIGVDNVKTGASLGTYFLNYVKENGGKAKIGIVGALNSFIQNQRQKGFEDKIKGADGVEMAGVVDGQNIQDNALSAAENLITANPDLTAIYATGEPAIVGSIAAVESQGKQGQIAVFGWDLTAQVIQAIDDGTAVAVVQQDPAGMGKAAVDALDALSEGKTVEAQISVPATIVTKENADSFRKMFDE